MIILKNDTFIERKDALIDMEDRGFQFGDGVYEVIRIYNGKFFLLEDHLKRLQYSLNEAQIDVDLAKRGIKEKLIELAEKNSVDDGGLYIQISRGVAPRNHFVPCRRRSNNLCLSATIEKTNRSTKKWRESHSGSRYSLAPLRYQKFEFNG